MVTTSVYHGGVLDAVDSREISKLEATAAAVGDGLGPDISFFRVRSRALPVSQGATRHDGFRLFCGAVANLA